MTQELHALEPIIPSAPSPAMSASEVEAAGLAAFKDIFFGSAAGIVGKTIEYPFDTIKVRLQSQPDDRPRYRGPLDCFKQSFRHEGIRGLYRGISSPLVGAAAENSALFFSYNVVQDIFRRTVYSDLGASESLPLNVLVLCGGASGAFASFILTPIELIKCKMQVQNELGRVHIGARSISSNTRHAGPIALIGEVYRSRGLGGFWLGQMGTFIRETGGSAAWFGAYEYVSFLFRRWKNSDKLSSGELMAAGAAAGVSYNVILFPADTVKSRMQTESIRAIGEKTKGFWDVGRDMYKVGGVSCLYRGCGITVLRSAPSSAIIFLVYETLKSSFR